MKLKSVFQIAVGLAGGVIMTSPTYGCLTQIGWIADLSTPGAKYSPTAKETGMAEMKFDWVKPYGTLTVKTKNVRNVVRIELRQVRHPGETTGPAIVTIYDSKDGPYRGQVTKTLTERDVPRNQPSIDGYVGVPDVMLHHRALVAICTKSHPKGEIVGLIAPHQVVSYSTSGSFHDPNLHHRVGPGGI